jgi:hypothetical protein
MSHGDTGGYRESGDLRAREVAPDVRQNAARCFPTRIRGPSIRDQRYLSADFCHLGDPMNRKLLHVAALATLIVPLTACDAILDSIFDEGDDEGGRVVTLQWYEGDELMRIENVPPGQAESLTVKNDRSVELVLVDNQGVEKVELDRDMTTRSTTCEMMDDEGAVKTSVPDFPATTTTYTLRSTVEGELLEYGPFEVTVEPANEVVTGNGVFMSGTGPGSSAGGPFFQTRHAGWGAGRSVPNWSDFLAEGAPRVLDFATVTEGGVLQAISPDMIQDTTDYVFEALANDCGFMGTTFAEYTGTLDPEVAHLTLEEVQALPDPPAGATSITLSEDLLFVYLTEEGNKGLVKVVDVMEDTDGTTLRLWFSSSK